GGPADGAHRRVSAGLAHAPEGLHRGPGHRPAGTGVRERHRRGRGGVGARVGLLTPYAWDVPGGVNFHIRDLAENLIARGHEVQVLAPADDERDLPPYVTSAGSTIPVNYNGSTARVSFGPIV